MDLEERLPVRGFIDELLEFLSKAGTSPLSGSPADDEINSFARPESVRTAFSQAALSFIAATDHLEALDHLVAAGDYAVAPWTCARGMLEAAAIADWLLDLTVDAKERVGRSLALRFSSLQQQRKMAASDGNSTLVATIDTRLSEVEQVAVSLGYPIFTDKKGRRIGIAKIRPSITELIAGRFDVAGVYRGLSALAHADSVAISQLATDNIGYGSCGVLKQRAVKPELMQLLLTHSTALYLRPAWGRCVQYGCDRTRTIILFESISERLTLHDRMRFWRAEPPSS